MKIILAGSYEQFRRWCEEQGVSFRDRSVVYAADEHSTRGIHGAEIIVTGTFWERKDAERLYIEAHYAKLR